MTDRTYEPTSGVRYHAFDDDGFGCQFSANGWDPCHRPEEHPVHHWPGDGLTNEQRAAEYHSRLADLVWGRR